MLIVIVPFHHYRQLLKINKLYTKNLIELLNILNVLNRAKRIKI